MSAASLSIYPKATLPPVTIQLPASKSESNRALIIQALCLPRPTLHNLSEARDTQTMQRLLNSEAYELDVLDAGTTMRFLAAYCAASGREALLTGTPRMLERPIGPLVNALQQLGAPISYAVKDGYPPLKIEKNFQQQTERLSIRSDISSQFISALLMIAPSLPKGLKLELVGAISSRPYIQMTLDLMEHFGARWHWEGNTIEIAPGGYTPNEYSIEGDWSGASYWFSLVALADRAEIFLPDLRQNSLQGDKRVIEIMEKLGVGTRWEGNGVHLFKKEAQPTVEQDFDDCPDLAQTIAVCCAAKGVTGRFTGLRSLRIKETDRIAALQNELGKIGATLLEEKEGNGVWILTPSKALPKQVFINTYDDHRMAMAFAPLATKMEVAIEHPEVVNKSFPRFWEQIERAGFKVVRE
jgi:3-phosphoshikimate 1-carboxyvinyltransferase